MEKNSVKINIAGVDYSLRTDESVELQWSSQRRSTPK